MQDKKLKSKLTCIYFHEIILLLKTICSQIDISLMKQLKKNFFLCCIFFQKIQHEEVKHETLKYFNFDKDFKAPNIDKAIQVLQPDSPTN